MNICSEKKIRHQRIAHIVRRCTSLKKSIYPFTIFINWYSIILEESKYDIRISKLKIADSIWWIQIIRLLKKNEYSKIVKVAESKLISEFCYSKWQIKHRWKKLFENNYFKNITSI